MIKAIVFDFFGVLCSDQYWRFVKQEQNAKSVFHQYANEVNLGEISWQDFVNKIAKLTSTSVDEVNRMYESENIDPRVASLIDSLHKKYKTGLLTNAHHHFIEEVLTKNHLEELFDSITVSSRAGAIKPDPKIFRAALEDLGVKAEETIYIDDQQRYVVGAAGLGMHAIVYRNYEQAKTEVYKIINHT